MPTQPLPPDSAQSDTAAQNAASPTPMPKTVLCPYCGHLSLNTQRCDACRGYFDPLSRQASQNSMGPWYIRDEALPYRPGCSYETLRHLIHRGKVTRDTILRGPSTRQFWSYARSAPGVANLLGECHACHAAASPADESCASCGASFACDTDRQYVGLAPVHLLPGHASPDLIAASTLPAHGLPRGPQAGPRTDSVMPSRMGQGGRDDLPLTPALDRLSASRPRRRSGGWPVILLVAAAVVAVAAVLGYSVARRSAQGSAALGEPATSGSPSVTQTPAQGTPGETQSSPQIVPRTDDQVEGDGDAEAPLNSDDPADRTTAPVDGAGAALREVRSLALAPDPAALRRAVEMLEAAASDIHLQPEHQREIEALQRFLELRLVVLSSRQRL